MKKVRNIIILSVLSIMVVGGTVHAQSVYEGRRVPRRPRIMQCRGGSNHTTQVVLQALCSELRAHNVPHALCGTMPEPPQDPPSEPPVEPPTTVETSVVISEVYYDVASDRGEIDDEWVELFNTGDTVVDISLWNIGDNDGSLDEIPDETTIGPGEFLLLSRSAETFTNYWSVEVPQQTNVIALDSKIGSNGLASTGDTVVLQNAEGSVADTMSYGSEPETAVRAFDPGAEDVGKGHSLSRDSAGTDTNTASDWSDLEVPTPGM